MSSSKSFSGNYRSDKRDHRSLSSQMCPYINRQGGCTKPNCPYRHPKGYVRMCPYMNTPAGCTNLKCPYRHPKGFVHACIFGEKCEKHATGKCPYLHPDERGFVVPHTRHDKPNQRKLVPRREAPPPPTAPRNVPILNTRPEKDEFGHILVYDEKGAVMGILDDGRFISFIVDIPLEVQEADHAWDTEVNDFDPEHPDDDDDEWESDPEAYSDHSDDDDEWETDPEAYPDYSDDKQEIDSEAYPEHPDDDDDEWKSDPEAYLDHSDDEQETDPEADGSPAD